MPKKRMLVLAGASLLLIFGIVIGLILMVRHEPSFYHRVEIPPGKARQEMSDACSGQFFELKNNWQEGRSKQGAREWDVIIHEAQLNSYFEEDYVTHHNLDQVFRKQGITDPRIALENDKLRLAFRYGEPPWSTIISYDLKLWLAKDEANVICVEFLGRHAGALPMATQSLLNEISDVASKSGFDISWYRHQGNPVALVKIQGPNGSQAPAQLRRLEVRQGWISISGVSQESETRP
jgi:hypothetical protein